MIDSGYIGSKEVHTQIRRILSDRVGEDIPQAIWEHLEREGYIEDYLNSEFTIEDLESTYASARWLVERSDTRGRQPAVEPTTPPRRKTRPRKRYRFDQGPDTRLLFLSEILALEASRNPDVLSFREEVLGGELLEVDQVREWLENQKEEHGPRLIIRFADGGFIPRSVSVRKSEPMHRLSVLAAVLTRFCPWDKAEAVSFILCGRVPLVPRARVHLPAYFALPYNRVQLDLDPHLAPQEVAALYRAVRKVAVMQRDRPLSKRTLELTLFLARRPDLGPKTLVKEWNRVFPEWAYSDERSFARAAREGWRSLTRGKLSFRERGRRG